MRSLVRLISLLCFISVFGLSLALRHATQGRMFTQIPSDTLAKMEAPKPADDAFAGLGLDDLAGAPTKVDNEFRLGLFPSGAGHYLAESASVLTLSAPPFLLFVFTLWYTGRRRHIVKV